MGVHFPILPHQHHNITTSSNWQIPRQRDIMSDKNDNESNTPPEKTTSIEEVKIGLSVKASLNVQKVNLIICGFLVGLAFCFVFEGFNQTDKMLKWLAANIFLPMFLVMTVNSFCVLYSIYAWTRTSMRYVYVDVFYVTTFSKLVNIFYCVYMLVIVFSPHHIVSQDQKNEIMVVTLPRTYLIVAGIVFSYELLNDLITICFLSGLYFKLGNFVKFLSKYYIVKRICNGAINLLIFAYYVSSLVSEPSWSWFTFLLMMLCLTSVLAEVYLVIIFFKQRQPNSEPTPPQDLKIQTAFKIVNLKENVKATATAAASA